MSTSLIVLLIVLGLLVGVVAAKRLLRLKVLIDAPEAPRRPVDSAPTPFRAREVRSLPAEGVVCARRAGDVWLLLYHGWNKSAARKEGELAFSNGYRGIVFIDSGADRTPPEWR